MLTASSKSSTSSKTTRGLLPPSSRVHRLRLDWAHATCNPRIYHESTFSNENIPKKDSHLNHTTDHCGSCERHLVHLHTHCQRKNPLYVLGVVRKENICSNFKMDSLLQKCLGGENLRMMSEGGASLSEASDDVDHAGREAHFQGEGSQGKSSQGGLKTRDVKTDVFCKRLKPYTKR